VREAIYGLTRTVLPALMNRKYIAKPAATANILHTVDIIAIAVVDSCYGYVV